MEETHGTKHLPPTAEIEELFAAQQRKAPELARMDAAARRARLRRIVAYLQEHLGEAQAALQADLRRAPIDTTAEMLMVKSEADFIGRHLERWMRPQRVRPSLLSLGTTSQIRYEPKGNVLILGTWNAPFACNLVPAIGAIAAGNAVILKPSELAPHAAAFLGRMISTLFAPEEVAVVEGGAKRAAELLEHPFNHIYFTGSSAVGRIVMRAAARHLASVTLEMGGKNPTIVDESADLENAAMKIGWGKCANCGQACVAPDYVLVDERIAERFVEAVIAAIRRMYDPDGEGIFHAPAYPRIVNRHHFDRLCALLDDALARGARIAFGGERDPTQNALSPTILTGVTDEMRIMEEEIFGPILPVLPYAGLTEVIDRLRTRPKPLALYIFSRNRERIEMLIRETRAGSTVINHNMIQAGVNPHLPFGGVNESGIGRAIGKASFVAFSNERSVVEQHLGWRDFSLGSLPPYRAGYRRALDFLFRRKLRG